MHFSALCSYCIYSMYICPLLSLCLSIHNVCMCANYQNINILCAVITHIYGTCACVCDMSKVGSLSSGSLCTACWRVPSMVGASTIPLTSVSYAPTWSSSSLRISSHPLSLVRERAEEEHASFHLRSTSQAPAPYW